MPAKNWQELFTEGLNIMLIQVGRRSVFRKNVGHIDCTFISRGQDKEKWAN